MTSLKAPPGFVLLPEKPTVEINKVIAAEIRSARRDWIDAPKIYRAIVAALKRED